MLLKASKLHCLSLICDISVDEFGFFVSIYELLIERYIDPFLLYQSICQSLILICKKQE